MSLDNPKQRIAEVLSSYRGALIAYSGGIDSTLLAALAHKVYGSRMLAVFAHSPFISESAQAQAREVAAAVGFPYQEIEHPGFATMPAEDAVLLNNPQNRCYLCKRSLLEALGSLAAKQGFSAILHGENLDDLGEDRPGARAAAELGVISPFVAAKIDKRCIRALAREMHLPNADAPSDSCLATRLPYDTPIHTSRLQAVAQTEAALREIFPDATKIRARFTH